MNTLSLAYNVLCGIDEYGNGQYTTEGINALCEGLKASSVTSLNVKDNALGGPALKAVQEAAGSKIKLTSI